MRRLADPDENGGPASAFGVPNRGESRLPIGGSVVHIVQKVARADAESQVIHVAGLVAKAEWPAAGTAETAPSQSASGVTTSTAAMRPALTTALAMLPRSNFGPSPKVLLSRRFSVNKLVAVPVLMGAIGWPAIGTVLNVPQGVT